MKEAFEISNCARHAPRYSRQYHMYTNGCVIYLHSSKTALHKLVVNVWRGYLILILGFKIHNFWPTFGVALKNQLEIHKSDFKYLMSKNDNFFARFRTLKSIFEFNVFNSYVNTNIFLSLLYFPHAWPCPC